MQKIDGILLQPSTIVIDSDPPSLPDALPKADIFRVCGAFYTGFARGYSGDKQCIDDILEDLNNLNLKARVYMPAVLISKMSSLRLTKLGQGFI